MIFSSYPKEQYLTHRDGIKEAIERVLESGRYLMGEELSSFETEFSSFVGARYGIGVSSGTDALRLSLKATNVGPGDEVITVSHTAPATVAAIEMIGAVPVLVDIQSRTFTLDPRLLPEALSSRTKAIVPVHLYGQPANMDAIMDMCPRARATRNRRLRPGSRSNLARSICGHSRRCRLFQLLSDKESGSPRRRRNGSD